MATITGGCACGAVRFEISGPTMGTGVCHCRACQYASGGGPNYVLLAARDGFKVTRGEAKVYMTKGDSGADIGRAFCAECGTPLYSVPAPGTPFYPVKLGALDDPSPYQPALHLYCEAAQPWHLFHDGLPKFPQMPPAPPPG